MSNRLEMDAICKELGLSNKNVFPTASPELFMVVVHISWLKQWMKNIEVDDSVNNVDFTIEPGENVAYPWRKIFIRVLNKKVSKVLPLPRYKLHESSTHIPLTFSQLLHYVSQTNQRTLWKESYKKYCQNNEGSKQTTIVNLVEHDQLISEVILRLYGCDIIRLKNAKPAEYKEFNNKSSKTYETNSNLLAALVTLETDSSFYILYRGHYDHNLLNCLNFSPQLIDKNYSRGMFLVYQLLSVSKAMSDRGLSLGTLELQDIYLSENLWLQIVPPITNNIHTLDASLVYEHDRYKAMGITQSPQTMSKRDEEGHQKKVQLEKLCTLWVCSQISNLDYLLHLNRLAGRCANDAQAHFMVPWVSDFASRCGKNWRDLSKSKYRLNKGDRQLDMTYEVSCPDQIPHHVTDPLSDITCYVYLARRTPKEVLCKHVRNKWVPAEYPASIQRVQEWTPDECIPEFYTDPSVFKSIHEDLPDLGIPTWASCAEDFITKHREALESAHVSDNLHHWIDITFGYKLSGQASIKAKNVCLSLVDGHTSLRVGGAVQLFTSPHPARTSHTPPHAPPRLRWTEPKKQMRQEMSGSEDISEEDEESTSCRQHLSRLHVPTQRQRHKHTNSRTRSLSKSQSHQLNLDENLDRPETRASSHTRQARHYRVQKSELGKGIIYLPKEFNPVSTLQALESLHNFKTKCFLSKPEENMKEKRKESVSTLNLYPLLQQEAPETTNSFKENDNAFTNHMFLASYDQNYLKKYTQDAHIDSVMKDRKNRTFNNRYTAGAAVYKQFITESRRQDMLVIGCLIVEIFLHTYMRPLRSHNTFSERYNNCRTVLKSHYNLLPKCVRYVAALLLNVQPPSSDIKSELSPKKDDLMQKITITDKGLPAPTPALLLQPLLMQHLIPFPQTFNILYQLLMTLHEYELTSNELSILYMYECDGVQCETYQNVDKTKHYFELRIAEGKIQACVMHLDSLLNQGNSQFDALDLFLPHYIELLKNKDTSVLAAWYLFDTVSKALGPAETKKKLLRHILNLYNDDDFVTEKSDKSSDQSNSTNVSLLGKQKFIKLYHNIFLLQLMVRLGLQCFLDNFTQYLVEAVGGYKDVATQTGSPGHVCHNRTMANKKPRYSDDSVKNALLATSDIFSPDTSYGSEQIPTPNVEKTNSEIAKEKDLDNRSENDLFHFETDKERLPSRSSRSKSPAESIESCASNPNDVSSPAASSDFSPMSAKYLSPNTTTHSDFNLKITQEETPEIKPKYNVEATRPAMSPTMDIPKQTNANQTMFTSYLHFADDYEKSDDVEIRFESRARHVKSLDIRREPVTTSTSRSLNEDVYSPKETSECKISDMSSESLIWLAHRLGPVLTCRYITRNLLKMLTLCYIGKDNLEPCDDDEKDEFEEIAIVNSRVVGDKNAAKVIRCLTSIVAMYGEQLIVFQYLPHMSELIASCRKRLTAPLEGGVVACLQLVARLVPCISDVCLMEQLQDTFLKSILQPSLRLCASARSACPSGTTARRTVAGKLLIALYALALRIGPEMTRRHLCLPALRKFFLAFDKATGKTENWPKQEENSTEKDQENAESRSEGFLEICRDGTTAEWTVHDGLVVRADLPDVSCTPPPAPSDTAHAPICVTAQQELLEVFNSELAHSAYAAFERFIGTDALERCLSNGDTIRDLRRARAQHNNISRPLSQPHIQSSPTNETKQRPINIAPTREQQQTLSDHMSSSNSFGSNVTLVGNRIDVATCPGVSQGHGFDVVAHRVDNGLTSNRHLRGDWLIYWEHEIGRPDKDTRFNLKQIKLQTFTGHTHSVKSIHCLNNETSFMSGGKDKTVRLWSLRNQGDGNATTQCNWTYTGHKKGVLSLTFLESLRLAVSTDSVVHIWDPFMESVVSQLENMKSAVSIVRAVPGPAACVVAATTDPAVRVIDARAAHRSHDLKLPVSVASVVRCMCVEGSGAWVACGLGGGMISVLDARTRLPLHTWRAHDAEVLRLVAVDSARVISSGLDQVTALWNVSNGEMLAHFKGNAEPVHCLSVYHNELISGTTNNRISVHTSLDQEASFSSTKLRNDTFKGILTCMSVLPLNRLLLLGSDNGTISLLC